MIIYQKNTTPSVSRGHLGRGDSDANSLIPASTCANGKADFKRPTNFVFRKYLLELKSFVNLYAKIEMLNKYRK